MGLGLRYAENENYIDELLLTKAGITHYKTKKKNGRHLVNADVLL